MADKAGRINTFYNIETDIIQKLFSKYDNTIKITYSVPIMKGMSTSNYTVYTDKGKFLLKIYSEDDIRSGREIAAFRYAEKVISVPHIYYADKTRDIIDRDYIILEFIEGCTLSEYINKNKAFPLDVAEKIGMMLALLHRKKYDYAGKLDDKLKIYERFKGFSAQYGRLINSLAGSHLSVNIKKRLTEFVRDNDNVMKELGKESVFCHGDLNFSNIMIDENKDMWFIDFEYSIAYPPYYDIGKFFRTRDAFRKYITDDIKESFRKGYNSRSDNKLDREFYKLSKLADIVGMFSLINTKNVPEIWIMEIENEIMDTLDLFS